MATNRLLRAALLAALVPVAVIAVEAQGPGVLQDRPVPALAAEPPMLGIHWSRGEAPRPGGGAGAGSAAAGSPNITWHSGAIMRTTHVEAIFWGPSWNNPAFYADKISGLDTWHHGIGGST